MRQPIGILFLCTHNSARSILAEALLNHGGGDRFRAYSAGSSPRPSGAPNPLALRVLQEFGVDTASLRSKSWDEFMGVEAPQVDLVITVCGNANEVCPWFPGTPPKVHWGYEDPSAGTGTDDEKLAAFRTTRGLLQRRLTALIETDDALLGPTVLPLTARRLAEV
jgi:arsenate reductase (thioredoxin)